MVLIYNLADTFFIGQTHDDLQVAAVSLATPVFLLFMAVGTIFGNGGTSVISRAMGEGRTDYAKKVCSFCMWSCVGVGIIMSALFLLFMDQILALIGASADTWEYAKTYLTIVSLSGPFVLIANCYSNVIRAEGQSGNTKFPSSGLYHMHFYFTSIIIKFIRESIFVPQYLNPSPLMCDFSGVQPPHSTMSASTVQVLAVA